jgi:hypothetical protein
MGRGLEPPLSEFLKRLSYPDAIVWNAGHNINNETVSTYG